MNLAFWAGGVLGFIWVYFTITAALGMPKISELTDAEFDQDFETITGRKGLPPGVSIIVPARNEEHTIAPAMKTLMDSTYPALEVIAVNDRSTDSTGEILDEIATQNRQRLRVVHITELPDGWLGKTNAMHAGAMKAQGDWLLFTDADVHQNPDLMRRSMAYAVRQGIDHLVVMPTMLTYTWGERMLIALFQAFFIFAQRPWKVRDPKARDFIGVGAFNLIRRSVYDAIGGYDRLRLAIIDDMKLGEMVKKTGNKSDVVFAQDMLRIHWASGAFGMIHNLVKNFFAALKFNLFFVFAAVAMILVLYIGPWVGTFAVHGAARTGYVVSLVCILVIYIGMSRRSGMGPQYFLLEPLAAVLMAYTMLLSAILTLWRGGVVWRGTKYSLAELKRADR